jgi:hypothetical protein
LCWIFNAFPRFDVVSGRHRSIVVAAKGTRLSTRDVTASGFCRHCLFAFGVRTSSEFPNSKFPYRNFPLENCYNFRSKFDLQFILRYFLDFKL